MSFGKALRELRVAAGRTQQSLAADLGVAATYISHLERDTNRPGWKLIRKAADVLAPGNAAAERRLMVLAGQLPDWFTSAMLQDAAFAERVWALWDAYCAERGFRP